MNILDLLDGVIRKPVSTFNIIAEEKPIGWALLIFAASSLFSLLTTDYSAFEPLQISPAPVTAVQIFFVATGLFIGAGVLHLLSRLFKGTGGYWGLFSALGFAQFPSFLLPLATLLGKMAGIIGSILGGLLSFAAGIWVLVLYVIALRESRKISTGASIITLLIPAFIITIPVIVGVVYLVLKQGIV